MNKKEEHHAAKNDEKNTHHQNNHDVEVKEQQKEIKNEKHETNKLHVELESLKQELEMKNKIILDYENHLRDMNKSYIEKIKVKTDEANTILKQKIEELNKQATEEIKRQKKYAIEPQANKLIDIISQLELAISYQVEDEKIKNYQNGFKMFVDMFKNLLEEFGIKQIAIKVGDEFNPEFMEAFEVIENKNVKTNHVVEIISNGYYLHDRLIEVAKVKIAK
ncbi:MAG: nucleotide exchange factor GrpE [Mycoplasmataceae bacterium]|jgi:molecular chaperone GrpE|nr:nucleotide exchange factor GrpE [Mycoplasmataceae bacterium]